MLSCCPPPTPRCVCCAAIVCVDARVAFSSLGILITPRVVSFASIPSSSRTSAHCVSCVSLWHTVHSITNYVCVLQLTRFLRNTNHNAQYGPITHYIYMCIYMLIYCIYLGLYSIKLSFFISHFIFQAMAVPRAGLIVLCFFPRTGLHG